VKKTILLIGAFDTKAAEYDFVRKLILTQGFAVMTMNTGVLGTTALFPIDVEAGEVARMGGGDIETLRNKKDRGSAMKVMCDGAAKAVRKLHDDKWIHGILGMGGTGGTTVVTTAMKTLPVGFPKVCVSTAASGDTSAYIGSKDITMIPSIVDVAGINRISELIFTRAAGAICGMTAMDITADGHTKPIIAASMFGNTTACVDRARENLIRKGYEVLVFHATGTGGKTMESLVAEGLVDAVLDITTTEWADTICGGVFDAGPERLDAPGIRGIPHLIVPGCIDMCNFGPKSTVPAKYSGRLFYEWNPNVTLMRTTADENRRMGEIFAEKANRAQGPVAFLLPRRGVSILDSINEKGEKQLFWDPKADDAFIQGLKGKLSASIPVMEMDANINDPSFSDKSVELLVSLIEKKKTSRGVA
jgi:uncharacterized protein (UPF0261 family)